MRRTLHNLMIFAAGVLGVTPLLTAQSLRIVDEQIVRKLPMAGKDVHHHAAAAQLSPDGKTILYLEPISEGPTAPPDGPVRLVIRRLDTGAEFRPEIGLVNWEDFLALMREPFSPDGRLLLLPDYHSPAKTAGGERRRPILICNTETGELRRTKIEADVRYVRVDATSRLLLYLDGEAFSLETGKRTRSFGYAGIVEAANPVAPLLLVNTGKKGTPDTPDFALIWNLRDNRLLAKLPTNPEHPYSDDIHPRWTRDGVYAYFIDVVEVVERDGFRDRIRYAKVWDVKAGKVVGKQFRAEHPLGPGPLPGTMFLRRRSDEGATQILHHAESGAIAEIPKELGELRDAINDKVAYIRRTEDEQHLCVATMKWDLPAQPTGESTPSTSPAKPRPASPPKAGGRSPSPASPSRVRIR